MKSNIPLTKKSIDELIKERRNTYSSENNAIPAFNLEQELSKEYNGRQILELIQNADDAEAERIDITFDSENQQLIIYNDGVPFDFNGIRSILIANYSSKVSSNYIGNKGLGFRSLIVWAEEIKIDSGGFIFTFSQNIALRRAQELNLELNRIKRERNLSNECCPFPILGIPEYEQKDFKGDYGCTITLKYKGKYEHDIKSQLEQIDGKTLLFLNNIKKIEIKQQDSQSIKQLVKKETRKGYLEADGIEWEIIDVERNLPQKYQDSNKLEIKKYEIKIAIPIQTQPQSYFRLYNYLPTSEELTLPYIIHATLDLDSSRKHINDNDINKYILGKVAERISSHVDSVLDSSNQCNWDAYEMMTPKNPSSSEIINDSLYKKLIELRDKKRIFPTVGLNYVTKEEYYFFSEEDSAFWSNYSVKKGNINKILFKTPNFLMSNSIDNREILPEEYVSSLKEILETELKILDRAKLICYLVCSGQIEGDPKLDSVFVNDSNQIIKGNDDTHNVFTPKPEGVEYKLPQFINIEFINRNLYDIVLGELKKTNIYQTTITAYKDSKDTRVFSSILSKITRISDYDKNDIIRVIISQSNTLLKNYGGDKVSIIKEMVSCLFEIFKNSTDFATFDSVPLLNQNSEVAKASKLLFSTRDNEYVFGNDKGDYLLDKEKWGIDFGEDDSKYQNFMRSLGVNQMTKSAVLGDASALLAKYAHYLFSIHEFEEDNIYNVNRMTNAMATGKESFIQLSDLLMNKVDGLSLQKIFYLLATNEELLELIHKSSETIKFQYLRLYYKETSITFLRFQFLRLESVRNKVLSSEVVLDSLDDQKNINIRPEIRNLVLSFLTSNLRGASEDEIATIVNQLQTTNYPQKNIRKVYKIIIDALSKDSRTLKKNGVMLCAYTPDNKVGYYPVNQIYYSDNTSLPKGLLSTIEKHRLYYTTRQGAKKVCDVFGIEPIDNYRPTLMPETVEKHNLNETFAHLFLEMKHYILLYCMQNLDSVQTKKEFANRLKKSQIILVKKAEYYLNDSKKTLKLNQKEFIQEDNTFYLNTADASSLEYLQNSVDYCNAITEILSIITRLEGKDDTFVRIFQNIEFMKQSAKAEFTTDDFSEMKSLLGMSPEETDFWGKVLCEDLSDLSEDEVHKKALKCIDKNDFSFEKVDYLTWLTNESEELLKLLLGKNIDVQQYIDLSERHKSEFEDIKLDYKNKYIHSLWKYLSENKSDQENFIKYQQQYDCISFSGQSNRLYEKEEYVSQLKNDVDAFFDHTHSFSWEELETSHYCLYPDFESILRELPIEKQSLFYFEGNDELIKSFIQDANHDNEKSKETMLPLSDDIDKADLKIVEFHDLSKVDPPKKVVKPKLGVQRNHSIISDRHKREAGKAAESLVNEVLSKNNYIVRWLSGNSDEANKDDTLGYDFAYKESEDSEWRYLEVKSFNKNSFLISSNEYEISKNPKYKGKYDIALVKDGKVYIIKNFFEGNNYSRVIENYCIYFKLPDGILY